MARQFCWVCGTADPRLYDTGRTVHGVECARCGRYEITYTLAAILSAQPRFDELRPYLSAYLRQASERGEFAEITADNWEAAALRHAHTPIPHKIDRLLQILSQRTRVPGRAVRLDADDFVLIDAADAGEIRYMADALLEQGALRLEAAGAYVITPKGWERLGPSTAGTPGTCFIAMAFDPAMDSAYDEGIEPAVSGCGLQIIRVDKIQHNGVVTDLIQSEIRRAQVVIADVTLQRSGVYFEAGLALGLNRIVVWSCRENDLANVHFDTRQYSHVVWSDPADLKRKLEARIGATVPIPVKF